MDAQKPKPISVDAVFGPIKLPEIQASPAPGKIDITLDTVDGQPVTATDSAKVYSIPPTASKFGFNEKIYLMAKTFGFDTTVTRHKLSGTTASFNDSVQSLTIDITNFNFTYEYDVKKDPQIFQNVSLPQAKAVEEKAADFLRSVGRYPEELTKGQMHTTYYTYNPASNRLSPVKRTQEANVAEVDFYRPDVDSFPIVSPKYFTSQNYVIVVFNELGFKPIKAQVKFFEKSEEQVGLYPVKTGVAAYTDLQEGKAFIVSGNPQNVVIKKMFLGYFDPDNYQPYLEPVYVFLGDNDFVAYVPAIIPEYTAK